MDVAALNYLAIGLAAVAGFIFGGVWYGVLGRQWMAAIGKSEQEIRSSGAPMPLLLGVTFVAQLIMAWVLAGTISHLGEGQVSLRNGVISAGFIWFGFVLTTQIVNHGYQEQKRALTVIDSGHWLGVLLIQGAVIGWMGAA